MADRKIKVILDAQVAGFQAKMAASAKSASDAASKMSAEEKRFTSAYEQRVAGFNRGLSTVGDTAGKVGLAAAAGLGLVSKAALDWETAWAGVTKTVDGSASEMAELEDGLRGLAKTLPATHQEIAAVAEAAGQLGIAREDIVDFTRTMIDLGETTNLTAEEAATSIAQMANVMQTAPGDIDNLAATLVALGNDGASTERDIIQMAQGISGAAAIVGLAEGEVLAIANAVSSMGIEVEAGGSAISRVLTDMGKATAQGGDDLDSFAAAAGMSAQEFATAFKDTPAEAFQAFISGLGDIQAAGGDVFTTLDNLGLADVRVSRALLGMASAGDLLSSSLELQGQAWEENTALALEAAKRYDTAASRGQVAWNNIKDSAIDFGDAALPVIAGVADKVSVLAQAVGALPGPVKGVTTSLLGVTAILGGGTWFAAKAIGGVSNMRGALQDLGVSADQSKRAVKGLGIAAGGLLALTAVGAAIDEVKDSLDESLPGMEEFTNRFIDLTRVGSGGLGAEFDSLSESIDRISNAPWTDLAQKGTDWLTPWDNTPQSLRDARREIDLIDSSLANLANNGSADLVAAGLENLVTSGELTAGELKTLLGLMPQYGEALAGLENDAKLAGGATSGFDALLGQLGSQAGDTAGEIGGVADAVDDVEEAFKRITGLLDKQSAFANAKAGMRELTAALAENGRTLDLNTDKGKANHDQLIDTIEKQLAYAEHLSAPARTTFLNGVHKALRTTLSEAELLNPRVRELLGELESLGALPPAEPLVKPKGVPEAKGELWELENLLGVVHGTPVNPRVKPKGVPAARGEVSGLQSLLLFADRTVAQPRVKPQGIPAATQELTGLQGLLGVVDDTDPNPFVDVLGVGSANSAINGVRSNLNQLDGDTATTYIDTVRRTFGAAASSVQGFIGSADGSTVPDDGGPYADRFLYALAPREEVTSNRHGQADNARKALKLINRGLITDRMLGLADGGTAGYPGLASGGTAQALRGTFREFDIRPFAMDIRDVRGELRDFREGIRDAGVKWDGHLNRLGGRIIATSRAMDRQREALDKSRDALRDMRQEANQFRAQVGGSLSGDVFGRGGLDAAFAAAEANRDNTAAMLAAVQRAEKLGLDGPAARALLESGDLRTAQDLDTRGEVNRLEKLFREQAQAQAALGAFAREEVFGDQLRSQNKLVAAQTKAYQALAARQQRLEKSLQNAVFNIVDARGVLKGTIRGELAAAARDAGRER